MDLSAVTRWLADRRDAARLTVTALPWSEVSDWQIDADGILGHRTGRFFRVARVARAGREQTLILQPEVGILGFALRQGEGAVELLVQAKTEPGNIEGTQLAPTVQATVSNYERAHGGDETPLLEAFIAPRGGHVLADRRQSEQGTRFLGKYNRNIALDIPDAAIDHPNWRWLPAETVCALIDRDYTINTDARSVLVTMSWRALAGGVPFRRCGEFAGLLAASFEEPDDAALVAATALLSRLRRDHGWGSARVGALDGIGNDARSACSRPVTPAAPFDVRCFAIDVRDREVARWQQPLLVANVGNRIELYLRTRNRRIEVLLRARAEIGYDETWQYGPSWVEELDDARRRASGRVIAAVRQSDEGGRFGWADCEYALKMLDAPEQLDSLPESVWVGLAECRALLKAPGALDNEVRSALSLFLRWLC